MKLKIKEIQKMKGLNDPWEILNDESLDSEESIKKWENIIVNITDETEFFLTHPEERDWYDSSGYTSWKEDIEDALKNGREIWIVSGADNVTDWGLIFFEK